MSYCRFSCNDFSSEVYCYESCSGYFVTHVAGNRPIGNIPKIAPFPKKGDKVGMDAYIDSQAAQSEFLLNCQREAIDLPHACDQFNDPDAQETLARLLWLRELGYNVPDHAISALQEAAEAERAK